MAEEESDVPQIEASASLTDLIAVEHVSVVQSVSLQGLLDQLRSHAAQLTTLKGEQAQVRGGVLCVGG